MMHIEIHHQIHQIKYIQNNVKQTFFIVDKKFNILFLIL